MGSGSSDFEAHVQEAAPEYYEQVRTDPVESTKHDAIRGLQQFGGLLVDLDDPGFVQSPREYEGDPSEVDAVIHMGCHSVKTPVIIDAIRDAVESLGYTAVGLGGYANCCGIMDLKRGDVDAAERADETRFSNIGEFDPKVAIAECTSCNAITSKLSMGYRDPDFEFPSFAGFLLDHVDELNDRMEAADPVRVTLHEHFDGRGWTPPAESTKVRELFASLRGVELVESESTGAASIPCNYTGNPAEHDCKDLNDRILTDAASAEADYVITFWHACQGNLLYDVHEYPVTVKNLATFVAERLGHTYRDVRREYVKAGTEGDVEWILDDARPTFTGNGLSEETARELVQEAFVEETEVRPE